MQIRLRRFELYSDASFDENKSLGVYSFILIDARGRIHAQSTNAAKFNNVFQAEIAGIAAGISALPDGAGVRSHSDLRKFDDIFASGYKSKHLCIRRLRECIDKKCVDFVNEYQRDKVSRGDWYALCHNRSNNHLRSLVGRGGKVLGER